MKRIGVIGVPGGWSSDLLAATVERKTGFKLLIDPERMVLDLEQERVMYDDTDLTSLDACIVKKLGPSYSPILLDRIDMLRFIESKGVPIFSRPKKIGMLVDRLSCTVHLRMAGIPMPPTVVTEDVDEAVAAIRRFGRAIMKPLFTSKARGMVVVQDDGDARNAVKDFKGVGNTVMYIQQMVQHPGKDLGVAFLGGKYLATYARAGSAESWNTTTNSGGKYQPHEPSPEILELAQKAQDVFSLDFTGVDVVETPDGPRVFEVSAFGGFRGLRDANGVDAAELYVDYVLERIGA